MDVCILMCLENEEICTYLCCVCVYANLHMNVSQWCDRPHTEIGLECFCNVCQLLLQTELVWKSIQREQLRTKQTDDDEVPVKVFWPWLVFPRRTPSKPQGSGYHDPPTKRPMRLPKESRRASIPSFDARLFL